LEPELRKDPVIDRWVIISTERGKRPRDYPQPPRQVDPKVCPFCPGNEAATPPEVSALRAPDTIPNAPGWQVRAISNKYPALRIEGELNRVGVGIFDKMNGVGAHEVIIETPDHSKSMVDLDVQRMADVLFVCQGRMIDLERDPRFRYLMLFKNQGEAAGASLEHSHSQLIATPVVPKRVIEELEGSKRYYGYKERCIFCDIIRQELHDGDRVVEEAQDFVAISPFAARFPYETWILPRAHQGSFLTTTPRDLNGLASILLTSLQRMKWALNDPAYNFMLHTSPVDGTHNHQYHWHIELIPKLTRIAGFEWGTGFYINPTSPEEAAEQLRAARPDSEPCVEPASSQAVPTTEKQV
jgi:UDPglucose--hexose-1-phosphate uridylyltransferase